MIDKILSLQFGGGFFGGDVGFLLARWEQLGVFSYVLPFLLIFALVFGILTRVNMFKDNKSINGILALTVSLLSLQFHFVPVFFSEIFPRLGLGLAIVLVGLILLGLFLPAKEDSQFMGWFFFIGALVVFIVVLTQSFAWAGIGTGQWQWYLYDNWPGIILIAVVIGGIALMWNSVGPKKDFKVPKYAVPYDIKK
ncbi:MAG: hypothetical protein WDZ69_03120 [Candidatus Pacearchaeota archaeon]